MNTILDHFGLGGRRALVTGGGKGLGKVMATALAQAGADVVLVGRNLAACEETASAIETETGRQAIGISADVALLEDVERMRVEAEARLGPIDILINNAGINRRGAPQELTEADWDDVLAVNLKAPFLCAREFGPGMADRGWGRIVNIGSILSVIGLAGRAPYGASKGGLLNLTRVLALEWATQGVTVNCICPGPFATEMNRSLTEDPVKYEAFVSKIPMGRWGELDEISGAALFLSSQASSYVTGSALFVDGGWTAQ